MNVKMPGEFSEKKSISMPKMLLQRAIDMQRQHGFSQFSDYVQKLIRDDVARATTQVATEQAS